MDDEKIGAFLDRELEPDERADVENTLATDSGTAARLRLLRRADDQLRRAMEASVSPGDHALAQRILNAEPIRRPSRRPQIVRYAALAAACVLGVLLGSNLDGARAPVLSLTHMDPQLAVIVATVPSGDTQTIGSSLITVAQTVRTEQGEYCRQLRVTNRGGATDALACQGAGGWRIAVATPVEKSELSQYGTASAQATPFSAAMDALGEMSFVDESEEAQLIERHWRQTPAPRTK